MYENEINRIIQASQNNALTFFVGAGVSALSEAPTWKGLIDAISDRLGRERKEVYSSDEFLQIPQMFYYSLGDNKEEYYTFIETQLHASNLVPNVIHREMLNLNPTSFITTNYDTLLEDAAIQYCQSFKVISRDEDVPTIFGDRFILKLHGDFKYDNFVLKEEDYLNYSENFKLIETLVKSIFSTNTVVFIGYSLNDYNIKLILNWTKYLLKGSFREPIFFYSGDRILTKEEILYQQSKGLSIVEWNKIATSKSDFFERYQSFFSALKNHLQTSLFGKTEDEAFDILYNLLQPLSRLNALRTEDVSSRLFSFDVIISEGAVHYSPTKDLLLNKFFYINQLSESKQSSLPKDVLQKYHCILDVFKKARITDVEDGHKYRRFIVGEIPFADKYCILFDYSAMNLVAEKKLKDLNDNYIRAFYLSRLRRYDDAFFLFSEVAKQAFIEKDYLLYYLAKTNCISLRKVMGYVNRWYRCYDMNAVDSVSPNDSEIENLFRRLPVEFRNTYSNLKDIHSVNFLYKYSYEAFVDGEKLQEVVESESIEFGQTSVGKAICRINGYLHFLLGNGIVVDVFSEYKNAVKKLMSLLIYKYSTQNKKILHGQVFPYTERNDFVFDEIDFYCFIEYFDAKEIIGLLKKYHIETIEFRNMKLIETAVCNLLAYYKYAVINSKNNNDVISLQIQLRSCLALLRYVNISQGLVDKLCGFFLRQEFREILIDDKILFLDNQLAHRKMYSKATSRIVENTLFSYLDQHIVALIKKEKFELYSASTEINYCNLVHYITPQTERYCSRRLSMRVSQIINNNLTQMCPQIIRHYFYYVSKYQQNKILTWVNKQIRNRFSFELFTMLVQCDSRINNNTISQLKEYLMQTVDTERIRKSNIVAILPAKEPYEKLNQVGYWCLINKLKAKDYSEFIGISAEFDFFCQYSLFDFSRFEVSWLLKLYPDALEQIAKNVKVKEKIRVALANELVKKETTSSDSQQLHNILVQYFC